MFFLWAADWPTTNFLGMYCYFPVIWLVNIFQESRNVSKDNVCVLGRFNVIGWFRSVLFISFPGNYDCQLYLGGPSYRSRTVIPLCILYTNMKTYNWLKVLQCYKLAEFYVIWKCNPINWCKWLSIILSLLFTDHSNNQLCQGCRRLHDVSYSCQHVK